MTDPKLYTGKTVTITMDLGNGHQLALGTKLIGDETKDRRQLQLLAETFYMGATAVDNTDLLKP